MKGRAAAPPVEGREVTAGPIYSEDAGDVAMRRYARGALEKAAAQMAGTPAGGRGTALNATAFSLGHYVSVGALSERGVFAALQDAADISGLTREDGVTTHHSCLHARSAHLVDGRSLGAFRQA